MKRKRIVLIIIICGLLFIISPYYEFVKSTLVMWVYSASEEKKSLMEQAGIKLDIPGGLSTYEKDWYPFVMVFNDPYGLANYVKKDVELSIIYNFGAFNYLEGSSNFYDHRSNYFGSFYGAYVTRMDEGFFGYNTDGTPNYKEIAQLSEYDMTTLVLESIGCKDPKFEFEIEETAHVEEFLGYSDWTKLDAIITTNSPMHQYEKKYQAYIQYGRPPKSEASIENFEVVKMKGRIYTKYFEKEGVTLFLYSITPNDDMRNLCDENFLRKTILKFE